MPRTLRTTATTPSSSSSSSSSSPRSSSPQPRVFEVDLPRANVKLKDVKLAALLDPNDFTAGAKPLNNVVATASLPSGPSQRRPVGVIQLGSFTSDTGVELIRAYVALERQAAAVTGAADAAANAANAAAKANAAPNADSGGGGSGQGPLAWYEQRQLGGLVLDLRGNPGGLLSSAVDVASLLVPKGSDLVSAQGRGFPGVLYRSNSGPIRDLDATPLVILVNGGTASAAEIVAGAVQDLDAGVILGSDRTFGKGLVQNIEAMPYDTALKLTVAKYYTPSGRCIQSTEYKDEGGARKPGAVPFRPAPLPSGVDDGGGGAEEVGAAGASSSSSSLGEENEADAEEANAEKEEADAEEEDEEEEEARAEAGGLRFSARKVRSGDRRVFRTAGGRAVKDGGGIEVDVKVAGARLSLVEALLIREGTFFDFASHWTQTNAYRGQPVVTDAVYADFIRFVKAGLRLNDQGGGGEGGGAAIIRPEDVYAPQLARLEKGLRGSGQSAAVVGTVDTLRARLAQEVVSDLEKQKDELKASLEEAILSRYLPESQLRRNALGRDPQLQAALALLHDRPRYDALLRPPTPKTPPVAVPAAGARK